MRNALLLLLLLGVFVGNLLGAFEGNPDSFDATNQLFDAGQYEEARQGYTALVERGEWSANLFYNLGNADYRTGSPGRAMLDYERALALDPNHAEARANLQLLRDQANAKVPAHTWMDLAFGSFSLDAWTLTATICGWLVVFCIVAPLVTRRAMSGGLIFTMILALFGCAFAATGAWHTGQDRDMGIIVAKQAEARFEPADRSGLADTLPAGSRVRVLSERGVWTYCELPGKGRGWVPAASVERVRLSRS